MVKKCLACKHEDPNPRIHVIPGTMNDAYLQSPGFPNWVGRDRRSPETLRPTQSSLITSNLGERLCCKEVDYVPENDTQDWLTSKCTHTHKKKKSLKQWTYMDVSALHHRPVLARTMSRCVSIEEVSSVLFLRFMS